MNNTWTFDVRGFLHACGLALCLVALGIVVPYVPSHVHILTDEVDSVDQLQSRARNAEMQRMTVLKQRTRREALAHRPPRTINDISLEALIASTTRFMYADLSQMRLYLYDNGTTTDSFEIISKGKEGSRWQTPTGIYTIETKETDHFSTIGAVHMPYSMEFVGNFFIHGWPYYPDGTPVARGFSGGCIRLSTADARQVYAFASRKMPVFVSEDDTTGTTTPIGITSRAAPDGITAPSYLLADVGTGRVYYEKSARDRRSIAAITKLMTALVANETIHYDRTLVIDANDTLESDDTENPFSGTHMSVGDSFYPLLMESNNAVASTLAHYVGTPAFVAEMNNRAYSIGADTLSFADATGISPDNMASPEDLFRLVRYLYRNQSFILDITHTPSKAVHTADNSFTFVNRNLFADDPNFVGGKIGETDDARQTMVALFRVPVSTNGITATTTVAAIVLDSTDRKGDIERLRDHFKSVAILDSSFPGNAANAAAAAIIPAAPLRIIGE